MDDKSAMRRERIALAVGSFQGGGAERVIVTVANGLAARGHQVDLLVGTDVGPYRQLLSSRVRKRVLWGKTDNRLLKFVKGWIRVNQYARVAHPAVLMSTIREFNILVGIWLLIGWSKDVPHVVREADVLKGRFFDAGVGGAFIRKVMRFIYGRAQCVVANSDATAADLERKLYVDAEKIIRIYNPVDISKCLRYSRYKPHIFKKIGGPVLLGCGRIVEKKNFPFLVEVLAFLRRDYPNAQLVILGQGEAVPRVKKTVDRYGLNNSVHFPGFADNPFGYFGNADVFVQASLWEGFGYVLVEAMACGTPVVALEGDGAMREILDGGRCGELVQSPDAETFAEAVRRQLRRPKTQEELVRCCARFGVEKIVSEYEQLLVGKVTASKGS